MQPAELAALLARETEDGLTGALAAIDSPGLLVVEAITARVGTVAEPEPDEAEPEEPGPPDWSKVTWQAETHFRVEPHPAARPGALVLLPVLAGLHIAAVRGAGEVWGARLTRAGLLQVGDLATLSSHHLVELIAAHGTHVAVLAGRAQGCSVIWEEPWTELCHSRLLADTTVLAVALGAPEDLGGSVDEQFGLWQLCLRLTAALDASVLNDIPLRQLPP